MSCMPVVMTVTLLARVGTFGTAGWDGRSIERRRLACARVPFMSGRHADLGRHAARGLRPQELVPDDVLLARTTPRPLTRYDGAMLEDLATPDAPRLGPLHGAGEALHPDGAVRAEGLGQFQIGRGLAEPQVGVEPAAGQV